MYGMLCALLATGLWLALATFLELPVSTTHSIVGAIIGMSLIAAGPDSIVWTSPATATSPFPGGVVAIILAWFITPVMAAIVAGLLFLFTKLVVLKAKNPFRRSLLLFPLYTFITVWTVTYFVIQKGVNGWMKNETYTGTVESPPSCPPGGSNGKTKVDPKTGTVSLTGCQIQDGTNAWISAVTAAVVTIVVIVGLKLVIKLVNRDLAALEADEAREAAEDEARTAGTAENGGKETEEIGVAEAPNRTPAMLQNLRKSKVWTTLTYSSNVKIHDRVKESAKASIIIFAALRTRVFLNACTAAQAPSPPD